MQRMKLGRRGVFAGSLAASACLLTGATRAGPPRGLEADGTLLDCVEPIRDADREMAEDIARHAPFRAAFVEWLGEASGRFALPVLADTSVDGYTYLRVAGLHPAVDIVLSSDHDINVHVVRDGMLLDILASMDVFAVPADCGVGWRNSLFIPGVGQVHPTVEACWREDGFEELLRWVNDELVPATQLAVYGPEGDRGAGWIEVRLAWNGIDMRPRQVMEDRRFLREVLPLHANRV